MGFGLGILFLLIGAVLLWVVEFQIAAGIDQITLGWIFMALGLISIVIGFVRLSAARTSSTVSSTSVDGVNATVTKTPPPQV